MRNNNIPRPNVVTWRAVTKPTGVVTRYRGVRPNNNNNNINNNHMTLAKRFQFSTLRKLRQLGLYTNTDTLSTTHQFIVEAVDAEVVCTMTKTQPSCSGRRESDRTSNTFKEAMDLPQGARWKAAPVLNVKANNTHKDRLVVQGISQIPLVDCGGTFAPECRRQSFNMMLVIAAELNYEVHMLDVQMAFLNADVEEDVLAMMAPTYESNTKVGVSFIIKLKKSLCGLWQSPKNYHLFDTMDVELIVIGFRPLKSDPCVHIYVDKTDFVILMLYVYDILFLNVSKTLLNKLNKQLMDRVGMSDMRDVSRNLGITSLVTVKKGPSSSARTTTWRRWCMVTVWSNPAYYPPDGEFFL